MKRLFANLAMASVFSFCAIVAVAQDTVSLVPSQVEGIVADSPESGAAGLLQTMEERFVEGNVFFMSLICLILLAGLILSIERVIFLNLSNVNAKKLLSRLEDALEKGDIEGLGIFAATRAALLLRFAIRGFPVLTKVLMWSNIPLIFMPRYR